MKSFPNKSTHTKLLTKASASAKATSTVSANIVFVKTAIVKTFFIWALIFSATGQLQANELFTLKNLERERATLIADFLSTHLDASQKQQSLKQRQRQLADMERMVLRDERLLNTQSSMVIKAFKEYELTFLVHAGAEKKLNAMNQWLSNVKLTNDSVMNAQAGYR